MTDSFASEPRDIEPRDETPHEHGGERGWTERVTFNFFDRSVDLGGVVALEYRPGDRRATASLDLFLPGGQVATVLARDANAKRADLAVGRVRFECHEQMKSWRLECRDIALVFPTAESANLARSERAGKAAAMQLELSFDAWSEPAGWASRRTVVDEQRFASIVSYGVFQQPGAYTGSVRIGTEQRSIDAAGFRERWWGTRDEDRDAHWCAVALDRTSSISAGAITIAGEPVARAFLFDGERGVRAPSSRPSSSDGTVTIELAGPAPVILRGDVLATIPERAGDPWFRSMVRFSDGRHTALGLMEMPSLIL